MSGLEESVRKLVREEAASAATETVERIRVEVRETMDGIRGDLRGIASAEFELSAERCQLGYSTGFGQKPRRRLIRA